MHAACPPDESHPIPCGEPQQCTSTTATKNSVEKTNTQAAGFLRFQRPQRTVSRLLDGVLHHRSQVATQQVRFLRLGKFSEPPESPATDTCRTLERTSCSQDQWRRCRWRCPRWALGRQITHRMHSERANGVPLTTTTTTRSPPQPQRSSRNHPPHICAVPKTGMYTC